MTRVLRYPFEAITSDTDYLQVTVKEYQPIGLGEIGDYTNENISPTIGSNNPAQITIEDVIILPMPSAINDRNQVKYGPDSLDNISAAVGGSVKEIMTKNPIGIDKNELAAKALSVMNNKKITSLCVYNKKDKFKTIGVLHIHNILQSNIS